VVKSAAVYSSDTWLKSWPGYSLSWQRDSWLLNSCKQYFTKCIPRKPVVSRGLALRKECWLDLFKTKTLTVHVASWTTIPWSGVCFEKLVVPQLVKKSLPFRALWCLRQPTTVLSHINLFCILKSHFSKSHFDTSLTGTYDWVSSGLFLSLFAINMCYAYITSHSLCRNEDIIVCVVTGTGWSTDE
jgi:hypothetical protein